MGLVKEQEGIVAGRENALQIGDGVVPGVATTEGVGLAAQTPLAPDA
jgi:hypothetical protein